ncbi:hypothetical protein LZ30DRAFT_707715 [Colletotrichum cereale]|nr:hypothetical protein LZ30DRAFT_707715 [Colletotrichum cereale]
MDGTGNRTLIRSIGIGLGHTTPIGSNPQSNPHRTLALTHSLSPLPRFPRHGRRDLILARPFHPSSATTHDFPFSPSSNPFPFLFPSHHHYHHCPHVLYLLNASSSPSQLPRQLSAGVTAPTSHVPLQLASFPRHHIRQYRPPKARQGEARRGEAILPTRTSNQASPARQDSSSSPLLTLTLAPPSQCKPGLSGSLCPSGFLFLPGLKCRGDQVSHPVSILNRHA